MVVWGDPGRPLQACTLSRPLFLKPVWMLKGLVGTHGTTQCVRVFQLLTCCVGVRIDVNMTDPETKYRVILEPQPDGGYTAYVPSLPGCISEGNDRSEALGNIREAIALYRETLIARNQTAPVIEEREVTV